VAAVEEAHPAQRAPYKQLASWAGQWFALRNTGTRSGDAVEKLDSFQEVQQGLLQALRVRYHPQIWNCRPACRCRYGRCFGDAGKVPQVLWCGLQPGQEDEDILDQHLSAVHYGGVPVPLALAEGNLPPSCRTRCSGRPCAHGSSSWWASKSGCCWTASSGLNSRGPAF